MWREILGIKKEPSSLLDLLTPRRSFSDVVLPDETRQQLYEALTQIDKHRLIFTSWGLGERHPEGLGLVFNFAGPPGTGKSICAEAVAYSLRRKLLRVSYAELESCWAGETGKNIRNVFREARAQEAVLFFDEADSIAARRFSQIRVGYERESNQSVNILLKEVEEHPGVVIFATNMAANFDPAFERRIRTHILFRLPSQAERERIWRAQIHPQKTPLGADVSFRALAEEFEVSGGDIRNAVLKAAQIAAATEGPDETKRITQRHFVLAMEQVLRAKQVMQQNLGGPGEGTASWEQVLAALQGGMGAAEKRLEAHDADLHACRMELGLLSEGQAGVPGAIRDEVRAGLGEAARAWEERFGAVAAQLDALPHRVSAELDPVLRSAEESRERLADTEARVTALEASLAAVREELTGAAQAQGAAILAWQSEQSDTLRRLSAGVQAHEEQLARATLLPWRRPVATTGAILVLLCVFVLGVLTHVAMQGRF
jgi:DNA polymerase III delta prime subunit